MPWNVVCEAVIRGGSCGLGRRHDARGWPTAHRLETVGGAMQKLQALESSDLFSFCTASSQAMLAVVMGFLTALLQGRCPSFPQNACSFLKNVEGLLQYFCKRSGIPPTSFCR